MKQISPTALFAIFAFHLLAMGIPRVAISQNSTTPSATNGRRIFNQSCAACHDTRGTTAKAGPGLKNYGRQQPGQVDATTRAIIRQGKGRMPGFSTLNRLQIDDLVAYLKTL